MPTNKKSTKQSAVTTSTSTTATKARTKARKPPVVDRVTVNAPIAPVAPASAAQAAPVAPPAPLPPPPPTPSPAPAAPGGATAPAPSPAPSGASSGGATPAVPVNAPPDVTVPAVPNGFVPFTPADLRGYRPMASEIAAVPDAVAELQTFTDYDAVFGITAPPPDQLTQRLTIGAQWTALLSQSSAWYTYVKSQEGMAWKDALLLTEQLKLPFQLAATANPALLSRFPALARLLGASQAVAKRATATKKKLKAATTAAAAAGAAAGTPPALTPGAGNGSSAATSAPAATRLVTVQG